MAAGVRIRARRGGESKFRNLATRRPGGFRFRDTLSSKARVDPRFAQFRDVTRIELRYFRREEEGGKRKWRTREPLSKRIPLSSGARADPWFVSRVLDAVYRGFLAVFSVNRRG